MLTSVFRHLHLPMLVITLTALSWSSCQAAGSFQIRPGYPSVVRDDDPPLRPGATWSDASARTLFGCGKGRVRDPQTKACRGPADIRSIAP
jgi:hypothetical protein